LATIAKLAVPKKSCVTLDFLGLRQSKLFHYVNFQQKKICVMLI